MYYLLIKNRHQQRIEIFGHIKKTKKRGRRSQRLGQASHQANRAHLNSVKKEEGELRMYINKTGRRRHRNFRILCAIYYANALRSKQIYWVQCLQFTTHTHTQSENKNKTNISHRIALLLKTNSCFVARELCLHRIKIERTSLCMCVWYSYWYGSVQCSLPLSFSRLVKALLLLLLLLLLSEERSCFK